MTFFARLEFKHVQMLIDATAPKQTETESHR